MCGIAGGPEFLTTSLGSALDLLAFRGPDGRGSLAAGGFVLGVQRLAITDLSAHQPIVVDDGGRRSAIVFNGSLADPAGLRRRCAALDELPRTRNDAELALRVFRAEGLAGLAALDGQFAFAIVDEAARELILGRDRFGEKPLFLERVVGRAPRFASTASAVRDLLGGGVRDLSRARDDGRGFARRAMLEMDESCFGWNFHAMQPGTLRVYGEDGLRAERQLAALNPPGPGESFEEIFARAVEARSQSDRPLGVFLSAGLDSALIASSLKKQGRSCLCLSLDFEGGSQEGERAAEVAAHLGLSQVRERIDAQVLDCLPDLVACAGHPLGDPSILAVAALSRRAREEGVAVVLGGDGADELFHGYRRARAWSWVCAARATLPAAWLRYAAWAPSAGQSTRARFLRALGSGRYGEFWTIADEPVLDALFGKAEPVSSCEYPASCKPVCSYELAESGEPDFCETRDQELTQYLTRDLLPKIDLGGMWGGIEARAPFLDAHVVAFALRAAKRPGEAYGKDEIRRALSACLPRRLRSGPKRGFAPPIASWLYARKAWVAEHLAAGREFFSIDVARELLESLGQGQQREQLVFALLTLALHAGHCDRTSSREAALA